jgi:hypothetical protein
MPTKIKQCTCKGTPATDFQDETYGKGNRVFNEKEGGKEAVCTSCGKTLKI